MTMEGKRFGVGLAAGLMVALALIAVSGGLGSTPVTVFNEAKGSASPAASTTVTSATMTLSSTTNLPNVTYTTSGVPTTTGSGENLNTNETFGSATVTTSEGASSTSQPSESAATNAASSVGGLIFNFNSLSGANLPSRLGTIAQQPATSNAEIFAPVLVAFLLGALLYRAAAPERERTDAEAPSG